MAKIELDNIKMWEYLYRYAYEPREAACILEALKQQGLTIREGKIVSIEPKFKIEKGKYYKCTKTFDKEGYFTIGKIYHANRHWTLVDDNGVEVYFYIDTHYQEFFRPATEEEIPHKTEQTKVPTDTYITNEDGVRKLGSESDKEELTEFEDRLGEIIIPTWDITKQCEECKGDVDYIKKFAKELMDLARKQITSEIDADKMMAKYIEKENLDDCTRPEWIKEVILNRYRHGIEDTLKAIKGVQQ